MELTSHQRSPVLEVDALTVAFGTAGRTVKAVDEVSLDVEEGDIYAVVGESGCGKSTLAYSLLDVVPPPGRVVSGEVRFKGRSFHDMNKSELNGLRAAKIAMVFQAAMNARNPVITIGRQVEHIMGAHPAVFGSAREGRAYFEELLGFLRLEPAQIWDSFESQLSGGMRQRVAVAIAMLLKPSVLVLDEPTTALDLLNQRMVVDMLRQLQRSFGVTIILITHDLGVVAEIATRVGVMYAGRLVETGTVEEIFAKGRRHPYVAALIEAIPSVLGTGLFVHSIPGQVPNLADLPSGCRFAPRCPLARDICVEVEPLLFATEDGHAVACHVVNDDVAELKTAPDLNALSAQDGKLDTRVVGYENAADRHRFVHGEILLREPASGQAEVEGAFGSNRPAPVEDVGANGRKGSMRLLEVDGVSHWFPETVAGRSVLDHINLSLDRQDIVAVVGESGCGKTTLGRIIAGLSRPADGEVHFDGRDIWTLKRKEFKAYRRAVQVVQQDPYASLNPGLTVEETLGGGLLYHNLVPRRGLKDELLRILREVGLDATSALLERYPHQLSGGQRQRVAIARSMSLQPRLVIADEATSMLDVSMRIAILDLLLSFQRKREVAFLFISHDFGVVRYFAQGGRVVVMFYGVVVEEGPCEEVIHRPRHPYTFVLLNAIPIPDPVLARRRQTEDVLDYAIAQPATRGCVFSNRCPFAEEKCHSDRPPLTELVVAHSSACWFPERVPALAEILRGGVSL